MWQWKLKAQSIPCSKCVCGRKPETLGEITVDEKSNEITAVPELLELLYLNNAIITADSMSGQRKIAEKIIEAEADYCIALKGNQPALSKDVEDYFHDYGKEAAT